MAKIIGILYEDNLKVFVYSNGHQVEGKKCLLNNCAKTISIFAEVYNVDIINLMGDTIITKKIAKELEEKYSLKSI
jgi:hypothetical protein